MLGEGGDVADARPGDLRASRRAASSAKAILAKASCTILLVSSRRSLRAMPVAYLGSFSRPGRSMTSWHSRSNSRSFWIEISTARRRSTDRRRRARWTDASGRASAIVGR